MIVERRVLFQGSVEVLVLLLLAVLPKVGDAGVGADVMNHEFSEGWHLHGLGLAEEHFLCLRLS